MSTHSVLISAEELLKPFNVALNDRAPLVRDAEKVRETREYVAAARLRLKRAIEHAWRERKASEAVDAELQQVVKDRRSQGKRSAAVAR